MTEESKHRSVVVSPSALVSMMLHAARHGTTAVHGILLGTFDDDKVTVTSAIPVCHEAPTKPLVDTALSLVVAAAADETSIVGWYTAPERVSDVRPGTAALRIVSSLASGNKNQGEPVLCVLQNESLAKCLKGSSEGGADVIKAYGKDFGQQWLEPLKTVVTEETNAVNAAREARRQDILINDFVDHLEADTASAIWYPNPDVEKLVKSQH